MPDTAAIDSGSGATSAAPRERVEDALITVTVRAYAVAIDRRDFELLRSIVTDSIDIDFTSYDPTRQPLTCRAETWIAGLAPQLIGLDATLHTISDLRITRSGDRATCTSDVRADHHLLTDAGATYTLWGQYTDTLVRSGDGWRISAKVLELASEEGDRRIMADARRRGEGMIALALRE